MQTKLEPQECEKFIWSIIYDLWHDCLYVLSYNMIVFYTFYHISVILKENNLFFVWELYTLEIKWIRFLLLNVCKVSPNHVLSFLQESSRYILN